MDLIWIVAVRGELSENTRMNPDLPAARPYADSLDEAQISHLVDCFYNKVSADPLLGAVFNPVIKDWVVHKRLLTSFWCSVALPVRTYRGNPLAMHRPHPIRVEHFERWLALWRETTHEVLDADAAAAMCAHAERIGQGMKLGLGLLPSPLRRAITLPIVGSH